MNRRCAFAVQFIVIRKKIETAQPAVQWCADVHFFFVIRTGVREIFYVISGVDMITLPLASEGADGSFMLPHQTEAQI
jgi:hypothetical protein